MVKQIREVHLGDLDFLLGLQYQLSPKKEEDKKINRKNLLQILSEIIKSGNQKVYVYELKGKLVGTATLLIQKNLTHGGKPYAHIEYVVSDENHRRRGIGKALREHVKEEARKAGCYKAILVCEGKNVGFYEKCDMRVTGEIEMRTNL